MQGVFFVLLLYLAAHSAVAVSSEVDVAMGILRSSNVDHVLRAPHALLEITRHYAATHEKGELGSGWRLDIASRLEDVDATNLLWRSPEGDINFRKVGAEDYLGPDGLRLSHPGTRRLISVPGGAAIDFGADGKETSRRDAHGNQIEFAHDPQGRLARVSAGQRSELRFSYRADGQLGAIEDAFGRKAEYAYDGQGRLVRFKDVDGWSTAYRYDDKNRLISVEYPDGANETFVYDRTGRVTERRDASGAQERYAYRGGVTRVSRGGRLILEQGHDASGRPIWHQDATGRRETWTWNESGQLLGRRYADGSLINLAYDDQGRLISQESSTGRRLRIHYDARGRVQKLDSNGAVTGYEYDDRNNVKAVTSPAGRITRYEHDAQGRLVGVTDGAGRKTRLEFNHQGLPVRREEANGATTRWEYDDMGRPLREVDPLGGVTAYHYLANGLLAKVLAPGMPETRFEYDGHGRLVAESQAGIRTEYVYDDSRRLSRVRYGDGMEERYAYDAEGRLAERTDVLGNQTRWRYDGDGRLQRKELPGGLAARFEYPKPGHWAASLGAAGMKIIRRAGGRAIQIQASGSGARTYDLDADGRLVRATSPTGGETRWQYDADGLPTRVRLPSGEDWRYQHDRSARLDEVRFPDGTALRMQYNPIGRLATLNRSWGGALGFRHDLLDRLVERVNGRGQAVRYTYDAAGHLTSKVAPDETWKYRYDEHGALVEAGNGKFSLRYEYDAHGRLNKVRYPEWGREVAWRRDRLGRVVRREGPDGLEARYVYDTLGRVSAIEDSQGTRFGFAYDDFGRLVKRDASNGTQARYEYDDAGRVASVNHTDARGRSIVARRYRYDADGKRIEVGDEEGRQWTYRYDRDGQLRVESGPGRRAEYVYGPAGSRGRAVGAVGAGDYRYDARGRLARAGATTYEYDADGQLAARRDAKGTTRYRFDAEGRLVRVTLPSGKAVSYGYGPFGERLWREEGGKRTYFIHEGDNVIAELSERFAPLRTYLYAGIDQPLAVAAPGAPTRYLHLDDLDSLLALTDASGARVGRYELDGFGNVMTLQGDAEGLAPRFAGRPLDTAVGLYDMRARFYDPMVGRFISPDPVFGNLDDPLSFAPYLYARNNPWGYVDRFGDQATPTLDAGNAAWGRIPSVDLVKLDKYPQYGGGVFGRPLFGVFPYEQFNNTIDAGRIAPLVLPRDIKPGGPTFFEDPAAELRRLDAMFDADKARRAAQGAMPTVKVPPAGGGAGGGAQAGVGNATILSGQPASGGVLNSLRSGAQRLNAAAQPYAAGAQTLSQVTGHGLMAINIADIAGEAYAADDYRQVLSDRAMELGGSLLAFGLMRPATMLLAQLAPAAVTVGGAVLGTVALTAAALNRVSAAAEQRTQQLQAEIERIRAESRASATTRNIDDDKERHLDGLEGKAAELRRLRGELASQKSEAEALELEAANQRNAAQAKAGQVEALRARIRAHEAVIAGLSGKAEKLDVAGLRAQKAAIEALAQRACAEGTGIDRAGLAEQAETLATALEAAANPPDQAQALAQLQAEVGVADGLVGEAEEIQAALQGYRTVLQERSGAIQGLAAGYSAGLRQARNMQVAVMGSANRLRMFMQGGDLDTVNAIALEASAGLPAEGVLVEAARLAEASLGAVDVGAMLGGVAAEAQSNAGVAALYLATAQSTQGVPAGVAAEGRAAADRARECAGRLGAQVETSTRECDTDQQCALGYVCDPTGKCVRDPRYDQAGSSGQTSGPDQPGCATDSDCRQGERCREGRCVTPRPAGDTSNALNLFGEREQQRQQEIGTRGGGSDSGGGRYTGEDIRDGINLLGERTDGENTTGGAGGGSGGGSGTGGTKGHVTPTTPVKPPPATTGTGGGTAKLQYYLIEAVVGYEKKDIVTGVGWRTLNCTLTSYGSVMVTSQTELEADRKKWGESVLGIVKRTTGALNAKLITNRVTSGPSNSLIKPPISPSYRIECGK